MTSSNSNQHQQHQQYQHQHQPAGLNSLNKLHQTNIKTHHHIEMPANSTHSTHSSRHSLDPPNEAIPSMEPYSDHSPTRHRSVHSNHQNQLDQDVQAALHFSRARAGTLEVNTHQNIIQSNPSHPHPHPPPHTPEGLSWSGRELLRAGITPSSQFLTPSSIPANLQNQTNSLMLHQDDQQQPHHHHHHHHQPHHNQFHHLHRSLSDQSLDSSHGAFIDHRPTHILPSPIARSQLNPIHASPDHHLETDSNHPPSSLPGSHSQRLYRSPCNLIDDPLPPSISPQASLETRHYLHSPIRRPHPDSKNSSDLLRDSLAFLNHDPSTRNQVPNRESSQPAVSALDSKDTQVFNVQPLERDGSFAATSPRPSQAEEDVCFPTLEADRSMNKEQPQPPRLDNQKLVATGHQRGTAGMLPHFPFPFNFQALEEFASSERETLNLMRNRRILGDPYHTTTQTPGFQDHPLNQTNRLNETEGIVPFTDEEENPAEEDISAIKDSAIRRRKIGFLSSSVDKTDESGISERRTFSGATLGTSLGGRMGGILSQRRLSENVRPISSAQRKLALFEGAGSNLLNGFSFGSNEASSGIGGPGGSLKANGGINHSDTRATFLGSRLNRFQSGGGGGDGGMAGNSRHHQVRWMNNNDRPYRFSFYSNALPSTIHARSLAEIPGEGQTFEDLFVGRSHTATPKSKRWELAQEEPHDGASHVFSNAQHQGSANNHQSTHSPHSDLIHLPPPTNNTIFPPSHLDKSNSNGSPSDAQIASIGQPFKASPSFHPPLQQREQSPLPQQQPQQHASNSNNHQKQRNGVLLRTDEDAEANTWWLDVLSPTDQEMKLLSKVFGIHPLTTEDILMEETREKIELFRNYYLVCFRSFDQDPYSPTYLEPLNIYIIVFREGTLSFHFRAVSHPQNVRRRIKQLKDYINVTSDWISYALIDDITDAFGPLIQSIEYEVDSIDELVLILKDVEQSDMLRRIGTCRKKVMGLLRLMGNKADVVKGLAKRCNENWLVAPKSDIGLYLSDIQDHLVTMTQNLNHYEKILSRSHSNYLAQISIEMTDANNQINDVLSKLTALGSILVPMNLVTGLWGMNVHVPGQDIAEGYAWFIAIVCALVSFGIIGAWLTLRYFKFSHR